MTSLEGKGIIQGCLEREAFDLNIIVKLFGGK